MPEEVDLQRFKNIVLIHECDARTLERAATLAKDNRAQLTIVHAIKEVPANWQALRLGSATVDVRQLVEREHESRLAAAAKAARAFGVRSATRLLVGEPSVEIIRDVLRNDRDLAIMTAEGRGGWKERLFGSLSSHLMRKCPVPLLVMKPSRRKRFHNVLAAIDPEETGEPRDTLNGRILELAASCAAREDARLHVVHAWNMVGESILRGRAGLNAGDVNRVVGQERSRREQLVEAMLKRHAVRCDHPQLVKGEPGEVIPDLVRTLGIDLLVMGTICRAGLVGFIIGNTAERVLDTVDCSVLTVKPEGFVSPVKAN